MNVRAKLSSGDLNGTPMYLDAEGFFAALCPDELLVNANALVTRFSKALKRESQGLAQHREQLGTFSTWSSVNSSLCKAMCSIPIYRVEPN